MALKYKSSATEAGKLVSVEVPLVVTPSGGVISKIKVNKSMRYYNIILIAQDTDLIMVDFNSLDDFIEALKAIKERGV